jgi:hypothetical protein
MGVVRNTRLLLIRGKEDDMNRVKKDATNVKFTWNGMVCGVHAVVISSEQNQEALN